MDNSNGNMEFKLSPKASLAVIVILLFVQFLKSVERAEAERMRNEYLLLDYGRGWDAPEL